MRKLSIQQIRLFASSKNGKLLSTEYYGNKVKLHWECEKQHQFYSKWNDVKDGHWCPSCAKNNKLTLTEAETLAHLHSGRCLSTEYKNCMTKLLWECKEGHTWFATVNHIKQSESWCPFCASFTYENKCRDIFSDIYKEPFAKHRVYYDSINKLRFFEFDGFNANLSIAFEYHGKQHYVYPNFWHSSKQEFLAQLERDVQKRHYCKKFNIRLIEIPYTENKTLQEFILRELSNEI